MGGPTPTCEPIFEHGGEAYFIGDWVALNSEAGRDWVGLIVDYERGSTAGDAIGDSGTAEHLGKFLCQWAWFPNDLESELPAGAFDASYYSGMYEVITTSGYTDWNFVVAIKYKVKVVTYENFKRLPSFPTICESNSGNALPTVLFYRQSVDPHNVLVPPLPLEIVTHRSDENHPAVRGRAASKLPDDPSKYCLTARCPDVSYYTCAKCKQSFDLASFDAPLHRSLLADSIDEFPVPKTFKTRPSEPDLKFTCHWCSGKTALPSHIRVGVRTSSRPRKSHRTFEPDERDSDGTFKSGRKESKLRRALSKTSGESSLDVSNQSAKSKPRSTNDPSRCDGPSPTKDRKHPSHNSDDDFEAHTTSVDESTEGDDDTGSDNSDSQDSKDDQHSRAVGSGNQAVCHHSDGHENRRRKRLHSARTAKRRQERSNSSESDFSPTDERENEVDVRQASEKSYKSASALKQAFMSKTSKLPNKRDLRRVRQPAGEIPAPSEGSPSSATQSSESAKRKKVFTYIIKTIALPELGLAVPEDDDEQLVMPETNGDNSNCSLTSFTYPTIRALVDAFDHACVTYLCRKIPDKRLQKQKLFEIIQNLKRPANRWLREGILGGSVSFQFLVTADTMELAPQEIKEERRIEQERYFAQQILLTGNDVVLMKKDSRDGSSDAVVMTINQATGKMRQDGAKKSGGAATSSDPKAEGSSRKLDDRSPESNTLQQSEERMQSRAHRIARIDASHLSIPFLDVCRKSCEGVLQKFENGDIVNGELKATENIAAWVPMKFSSYEHYCREDERLQSHLLEKLRRLEPEDSDNSEETTSSSDESDSSNSTDSAPPRKQRKPESSADRASQKPDTARPEPISQPSNRLPSPSEVPTIAHEVEQTGRDDQEDPGNSATSGPGETVTGEKDKQSPGYKPQTNPLTRHQLINNIYNSMTSLPLPQNLHLKEFKRFPPSISHFGVRATAAILRQKILSALGDSSERDVDAERLSDPELASFKEDRDKFTSSLLSAQDTVCSGVFDRHLYPLRQKVELFRQAVCLRVRECTGTELYNGEPVCIRRNLA